MPLKQEVDSNEDSCYRRSSRGHKGGGEVKARESLGAGRGLHQKPRYFLRGLWPALLCRREYRKQGGAYRKHPREVFRAYGSIGLYRYGSNVDKPGGENGKVL